MDAGRFDVAVVGAGPAGSVSALILARGGARVALVDKAAFPRDKACGDLIGPRGLRLLHDLGVDLPGAEIVADMVVVGPAGRRVRLPCAPGTTYPGHGVALPRRRLDDHLREAALRAGAQPIRARLANLRFGDGPGLDGCVLDDGRLLRADAVIGADGATSRVADAAGLVDPQRVLWGFAVRRYVEQAVALPHIVLWEQTPGRAFPGYGWIFPGTDGRANVGLGLGVRADRSAGTAAARQLPAFLRHLGALELLDPTSPVDDSSLGGWLKIGMIGTAPARGPVLLVGDAAGLVNPLQGEGIGPALLSAAAAANALLDGPADAARRYRAHLAERPVPYFSVAAAAHATLISRPRAVAAVGRLVTAPAVGRAVAGGWSLFWNDLVDGAFPGRARAVARAAEGIGVGLTAASRTRSWLRHAASD